MPEIAIVGMACVFPGAPNLETYFQNLTQGADAIQDVPPNRWDPAFYDPTSSSPDRFYCKRGGFIDAMATFDPAAYGVMPVAAKGAEPDQLLMLEVASRALADAGYAERPFARNRTGVVIGRGNYPGAGRARLEQQVRTAEQLVRCLRSLLPDLPDADLARVKAEFQAAAGVTGPDAAIGLVPNLTASRLSNRLDLGGPAFTVDAACASSLVAVDHACAELATGRSDVVLAGGVHLCHDEAFWSVFCQLGALSRSQQIRPFDRRADGLLIGEGLGLVVLKRRVDAERDQDRIYAVIRGTGVSSDGRESSLMQPSVEGQLLALSRAWEAAGLDPKTIGFVEAHGTGTAVGDTSELATLRRFFGQPEGTGRAVLGSVKSMIGHTMPAAGIAGLIKAALSVHHKVLFPTIHCEEPHADLEATRFRVTAKAEEWKDGVTLRRAAVNAFGFGGINAHVVLEEPSRDRPVVAAAVKAPALPRLARFAASSSEALLAALAAGTESSSRSETVRLAIVDPTPARIERAKGIVQKNRAWKGRDGIWFSPAGLVTEGGKVAFVFPGVDASFEPRVDDLAAHFRLPIPACTRASNLEEIGMGIIGVNRLLGSVLADKLRIEADAIVGHSIGEWSGLIASGLLPEAAVDPFIATLVPGSLEVPGVVFAAAGCGAEEARRAMHGLAKIELSHDNCPHQVIFCGEESAVDVALDRLKNDGILCQKLPFRSGFHSPLFTDFIGPHRDNFARIALDRAKTPLWSATTCAPYPADHAAVRKLSIDHLVEPVRFRELVEALYADGVRVFVQVGTGSVSGFVEDTLRGRPHLAMPANVKDRSGLEQLTRLAAALWVEGVAIDWSHLSAKTEAARAPMALSLGVPLVSLKTALPRPAAAPALPVAVNGADPLASTFAASMDAIGRAQSEVFAKLASRKAGAPAPSTSRAPHTARFVRTISVETFPEVLDHCFFRQPPGWPNVSDRHPVVPMTTSLEIMIEAAKDLLGDADGRVVVGMEKVAASRWLAVASPVDVEIRCTYDGVSRVHVAIEGYSEGTVVFGDAYAAAPAADEVPLDGEEPAEIRAEQLYTDRWMFHGPRFAGITDITGVGERGVRGVIETGAARGALLDNAGQLFGFWVMAKHETNRLAMPVGIEKIAFYGPHPTTGESLACVVHIRRNNEREVAADLDLSRHGKTWARIEGWVDRRFDTDPRLWAVMRHPEKNILGAELAPGLVLFEDTYRLAPTRDQLARRFLGQAERATYEKQTPRSQRAHLNGRIAAKDAVRNLGWHLGGEPMYPVELAIVNDDLGRPLAKVPGRDDVRISIAHKDDLAIAMAAEGRDVGVDVEAIEPRADSFIELALTPEEVALIGPNDDKDEWVARIWAAKEAVGKARGTGLKGNPRSITVRDRAGERLIVEEFAVQTRRHKNSVLAWTETR